MEVAIWKHCIVWLGKNFKLDWMRITRPVLDRELAFQLVSLKLALLERWVSLENGAP